MLCLRYYSRFMYNVTTTILGKLCEVYIRIINIYVEKYTPSFLSKQYETQRWSCIFTLLASFRLATHQSTLAKVEQDRVSPHKQHHAHTHHL